MNINLNFDGISKWSHSIFDKIDKETGQLQDKIREISTESFKSKNPPTKIELFNNMERKISQFNEIENEALTEIMLIQEMFSNLEKSGGFDENQLLAYQTFTSSKQEIFETFQKTKENLDKVSKEIDQAMKHEFLKLEPVPIPIPKELPPLNALAKGNAVLEHFNLQKTSKDGNCLFGSISYSLYGTENKQDELRQRACDVIQIDEEFATYLLNTPHSEEGVKDYFDSWCLRTAEDLDKSSENIIQKATPAKRAEVREQVIKKGKELILKLLEEKLGHKPNDLDLYREFMRQDKSHGGTLELTALAKIIKRPILVFRGPKEELQPSEQASIFGKEYEGNIPIVLHNMPGHYDAYIPKGS